MADRHAGTLAGWLTDEYLAPLGSPGSIADVPRVRALLVAAARGGGAVSYSELLRALGHRFTRLRMRALCKTLDAIDVAGMAAGEPGLAVLVVRESDGLPGQGWWVGVADRLDYAGAWTGPDAAALVRAEQAKVFGWWAVARHDTPGERRLDAGQLSNDAVSTAIPPSVREMTGMPKRTSSSSA